MLYLDAEASQGVTWRYYLRPLLQAPCLPRLLGGVAGVAGGAGGCIKQEEKQNQ
jgi:hypothetical protein